MNHRSLAFRLGVWYALLLSASFTLVGVGLFYGLEHYLRAALGDSLRRRSTQIEEIARSVPTGTAVAAIGDAIEIRVAPEFNNRLVRVTRAPGELVYRSGVPADRSFDPAAVPPFSGPWPTNSVTHRTETAQHQALMMSATTVEAPSGRYLIELGASLAPGDSLQTHLLLLLAMLLPVLVALAAAGGYLLVGRALRPVDRIAQSAEQMLLQDLDARLPVVPTGDALERLSISVNHMLGRLRDSIQTSRRFLADASHELRTPLTVIKGELQELVHNDAIGRELRDRIGSVLEEVGRLEHLVSGLLVLSRLDVGEAQRVWVEFDLAELAAGTADQMRLMAEDRGIQIHTSNLARTVVRGDRARLKQVIVNLLDNAIRFTPRGGSVTFSTSAGEKHQALEIRDTGIGMPPTALSHIFDRFYRVDEARSREDGGAGLGLSIVRSICAVHGVDIEVDSSPGQGSCFRLKFPHSRSSLSASSAGTGP
jgi:heavy metal sensor kinase